MTLSPGTRVGPYEIQSLLGVGGMGEVYRATDTQLGRAVAVKVLPAAFAHDPDRVARFEREAKALASLNHPNIATIHGVERSPAGYALVMELVDGTTLAERIAQGPLPVDETLGIARQIAEALEAAHEQGIVHRDLKPANVKVRPDGAVKVLDFGLAKATEPATATSAGVSQLPTLTTPAMTQAGVIMGTAAYMSPEQATGKPLDKRTDIWAFGCVVYEMLTGRRAFEGDTVSETLARVLEREPDWSRVPAAVPAAIRAFLLRCLQRDSRERVRDIGDVRLALAGAFAATAPLATVQWRWLPILGASVLAAVAGAAAAMLFRAPATVTPLVTRTAVLTPGAAPLNVGGFGPDIALTPDGTRLVYTARDQLMVRRLSELAPTPLFTGTIPGSLFMSPDGRWVGFTERTRLEKISIDGGPATVLCVVDGTGTRGASWAPDGQIIFATSHDSTGLQRVSADGGTPTVLTRPDHQQGEADHLWPEILPGGRSVLFTITATTGGLDAAQVAVLDLVTGTRKTLFRGGTHARYVSSGHVIYMSGGALHAVAFDPTRLSVLGRGIPVLPGVVTTSNGGGNLTVSENGPIVYVASPQSSNRELVWVDRAGREESLGAPLRAYHSPRLSPDGSRVAVRVADRDQDIWMWELPSQALRRFTLSAFQDNSPVWTTDGRRLLFASDRDGGRMNLWAQVSDGTGAGERLAQGATNQNFTAVSPDGRQALSHEVTQGMARNLMLLPLEPKGAPRPLVQTKAEERNGVVSPDGRWLAYESDESGRFEVYVRPFPRVDDGQWRASAAGGVQPLWSHDGRELFFLGERGRLTGVRVDAGGSAWVSGSPATVVERDYFSGGQDWLFGSGQDWLRTYDVSPDGRRFLMIKEADDARPTMILVQDWQDELTRLVPTTP